MNAIKCTLFVVALFSTTVYADPVTVPNTFTAGTPAKASEVNANFNALANAINANAGPKPLMVYDSTGKVVGQYYPNNCESCAPSNSFDQGVTSQSVVIVTTLGPAFKVRLSSNFYSLQEPYPSLKSYFANSNIGYVSTDCSGQAYILGLLLLSTDRTVPPAEVINNHAYVVDGVLKFSVTLFNSVFSTNDDSGICQYMGPAGFSSYMYPVSRVVDLSVFTPPFSVH